MKYFSYLLFVLSIPALILCIAIHPAHAQLETERGSIPGDIKAVMEKPVY